LRVSKNVEWMENLHGIFHGIQHGNKWIAFHGLSDIALGPSKRGGSKLGTTRLGFVNYLVLIACFISWKKWGRKRNIHLG
jgi:hypothetical protein